MSIKQRSPFIVIAALLAAGVAAATLILAFNLWAPGGNSTGPAGDPLQEVRSPKRGLRVLFIGNSFTHFHNMPDMLRQLAAAAHEELPLLAVQVTPGGYTLQQHCDDGRVAELIELNRWD